MHVVRTFLLAGVPLNKLPLFIELLEEYAYSFTGCQHMSDLVPFILVQEKKKIKQEIIGKGISIVFDGTTRLGEVFVIVVHLLNLNGASNID